MVRVFRQGLIASARSVAVGKERRLAALKKNAKPDLFSLASILEQMVSRLILSVVDGLIYSPVIFSCLRCSGLCL
jgi:hypothetical protein